MYKNNGEKNNKKIKSSLLYLTPYSFAMSDIR